MGLKRLNDLTWHDPLYGYLSESILPQMGEEVSRPRYRVFRLHSTTFNNQAYLYEEKSSGTQVVGKFFTEGLYGSQTKAAERAHQEYQNLLEVHKVGFDPESHRVIRPLGYNAEINHLLVEEYAFGQSLCKVMQNAVKSGEYETLYARLCGLGYFLATMHNRTASGKRVDLNTDCHYFGRLIRQLQEGGKLSEDDAKTFYTLCHRWKDQARMWEDRQVLVHGDATPPNFIFGKRNEVIAIDFERMKYADRIFDLGRIVGEMQHYFMQAGRAKGEAEPLIGHFLWEYSLHFPDQMAAFTSITARLPFQIAITLMRIARNSWISYNYSRRLLHEALNTLRGGI